MSSKRSWRRRAARGLAYAAAGVLGLVALVILALLLPPVRGLILSGALSRADAALPGDVRLSSASWSLPFTLSVDDLVWADGVDTLLAASRFRVSMKILPLLKRDLEISQLEVHGLSADIKAIKSRFPGDPSSQEGMPAQQRKARPSKKSRFPREGSLPGLPSLAVKRLRVTIPSLVLGEGEALRRVEISGGLDLLRTGSPSASLDQVVFDGPREGWRLESGAFDIDIARGSIKGTASGSLSSQLPFYLSIVPERPDEFRLLLVRQEGDRPPESPGVALNARLSRSGHDLESADFEAIVMTPGTVELERYPQLAGWLANFGPLEGVLVSLQGSLALEQGIAALVTADLHENAWLEGGSVRASYEDGTVSLDTLAVGLPDIELRVRGRLSRETVTAQAMLQVLGTRWLEALRPDMRVPDSLAVDLAAEVNGPRSAPKIEATVEAAARVGDFFLDALSARANAPGGEGLPTEISFSASAMDMILTGDAELDLAGDPTVRLRPLVLLDAPAADGHASERTRRPGGAGSSQSVRTSRTFPGPGRTAASKSTSGLGTVKFQRDRETLTIDNVRLTGALGDLRVDGSLTKRKPGTVALHWRWPEPPVLLAKALKLSPAQMDSLRLSWGQEEPLELEITGRIEPGAVATKAALSGTFSLPGPRTLSAIMPANANVGDLGPVRGHLELAVEAEKSAPEYDLLLDLSATEWIDLALARLSGRSGYTRLDTVSLALEGLAFTLGGVLENGEWDASSQLMLSDTRLIRRFYPGLSESLEVSVVAQGNFQGRPESPKLAASLVASAAGPKYRLPKLSGEARWSGEGLIVNLSAPEGLAVDPVELNELNATFEGGAEATTLLPGRLTFEARGRNLEFYHIAGLDRADGWRVHTDTIAVALGGSDLRSTNPFDVILNPERQLLAVDDLKMEGALGRVKVDGYSCPDSCELNAEVSIALPDEPPVASLPAGLWPEEVNLSLSSAGKDEVRAKARVTGFALGDRRDLEARIDLSGSAQGVRGGMEISHGADSILKGEAKLPALLSLYPPGVSMNEGPVTLDAQLTAFPIFLQTGGAGPKADLQSVANVDARVAVRGTAAEPSGHALAEVTFPRWPKMSKYRLGLEAKLAPGSTVDRPFDSVRLGATPSIPLSVPEMDAPGLAAAFSLAGPKGRLLGGSLAYPMAWSLAPPSLKPDEAGEIELHVDSSDIPLGEFDNLLPPNMGLEGTSRFRLSATGPADDPELDGFLKATNLKILLENGTRVTSSAEVRVSGSRAYPSVNGEIEIHNGVIRIPEKAKELHPAEGRAVLWEKALEGAPSNVADDRASVAAATPEDKERGAVAAPPKELDLDVAVMIPSGLWIRGRGLDVELAGELHLVQKGAYPTIAGDLQAVRGRLVFLGRTFQVDRGRVVFYGGDEINPSLDLVLSTYVEGTTIRILLGGTAHKPELTLTSEPEMAEGDIMSVLVFGRTMDELDNEQLNLLGRRAADIAAAFGTAQLEAKLSQQLGVDMVTIGRGSAQEGGTSLVIGKYLSPRVLLKYEQALEERARFFVNLEYFLNSNFKLETLIGHQSQSAIELNWTREY